MINQAAAAAAATLAAALQQTHEYWLDLRIWSHNIVNCYSWLLTQLLIILSSTLITHSQLDPSSSSSHHHHHHHHQLLLLLQYGMGTAFTASGALPWVHTCPWS
jgi:hypothetical protein